MPFKYPHLVTENTMEIQIHILKHTRTHLIYYTADTSKVRQTNKPYFKA